MYDVQARIDDGRPTPGGKDPWRSPHRVIEWVEPTADRHTTLTRKPKIFVPCMDLTRYLPTQPIVSSTVPALQFCISVSVVS